MEKLSIFSYPVSQFYPEPNSQKRTDYYTIIHLYQVQ